MSVAEALSPAEVAEVEAQLGLSGSPTNLPPLAGVPRVKSSGKYLVITYAELQEIKELGVPLVDFWVRVSNGSMSGRVPASKVSKWISQGYQPE